MSRKSTGPKHAYKMLQNHNMSTNPRTLLDINEKDHPELFNVEYPDLSLTEENLGEVTKTLFDNIVNFAGNNDDRYITLDEIPEGLVNFNIRNDKKYKGKYLIFHREHTNAFDYFQYNRLSSFFTDTIRSKGSKCGRMSVFDYYQFRISKRLTYNRAVARCDEAVKKNHDSSYSYHRLPLHKKYYELHEALYDIYGKPNECTTHPTTVPLMVYKYFNAKRILDCSSGWGDRAIAAAAYFKHLGEDGCYYHGLDPNEELHPQYELLKQLIGDNIQFYKTGSEDFQPKTLYDLMFTSPPYSDLEIYSKASTQSVSKFPEYRNWLEHYMFKTLDMCMSCIVDGGHIAINIINYRDGKNMLDDIIDYMISKNQKYEGIIWYSGGLHSTAFQPIAIFEVKKIIADD
jgi:hypothetical protein